MGILKKEYKPLNFDIKHVLMVSFILTFVMMVFVLPIFEITYFYDFCSNLYEFIQERLDLLILFYFLIVLPLVFYILYLINCTLRFFLDIASYQVRAVIEIFKWNYNVFAIIIITISLIRQKPFFDWIGLTIALILIILTNIPGFFIHFSYKDEFEREKDRKIKKDEVDMTWREFFFLIFSVLIGIPIGLVVIIEPAYRIYFVNLYNFSYKSGYMPFHDPYALITICILSLFSFAYVLIEYGGIWVVSIFRWLFRGIMNLRKFVVFGLYMYFFIKLLIFLVSSYAPEPYPTIISTSSSILISIINSNKKSISSWFSKIKLGNGGDN